MKKSEKGIRTKILTALGILSLLMSSVLYGCLTVSSVKPDSASQDSADCSRDRHEEAKTGNPMCKEYWPQEDGYQQRWQPFKKK